MSHIPVKDKSNWFRNSATGSLQCADQSEYEKYMAAHKAEKIKNLQLKSTLNSALARRVEELQKFKSMFFGTVKEKIKNFPEIKLLGIDLFFNLKFYLKPVQLK